MSKSNMIDSALITIKGGDGGNGIIAFRREKFVSKGGPSGGDGGTGGSIIFRATNNINTLLKFRTHNLFVAESGKNGGPNKMVGANGNDLIIDVPIGTQIFINNEKRIDLNIEGKKWVGAWGGKGGHGNYSFKSSKNPTPVLNENGEIPPKLRIRLELKVIADVGIVGYPNIGKSTFISKISNAKPKISNYEFTTLSPNLGLVKSKFIDYIVADLPGIIEGASENKGLGFKFLKHLERVKILVHFIDSTDINLLVKYNTIKREIKNFNESILNKLEEVIVFTKIDLIDETKIQEIRREFNNINVFFISSLTNEGVSELKEYLGEVVNKSKKDENKKIEKIINSPPDYKLYKFIKQQDDFSFKKTNNEWILSGKYVEYWGNKIPLNTQQNVNRIIKKFEEKGIFKNLLSEGLKKGDFISIENTNFYFEY